MDAMSGRRQTTRGIWLARSGKLPRPATLVMDLEGSDGRERGEDDNSFERQSALFALAVADVLLVNMCAAAALSLRGPLPPSGVPCPPAALSASRWRHSRWWLWWRCDLSAQTDTPRQVWPDCLVRGRLRPC